MKTITIPTGPSKTFHDDATQFGSDHVISLAGRWRFGIGGWNENGEGRIETGGPKIKGPYAYAFGLCSVIADNPAHGTGAEIRRNKAAGIEHEVEHGDILVIDGVEYVVNVYRREYINLVPTTSYERKTFRVLKDMRKYQALEAEGGWEKESETTAEVVYRRIKKGAVVRGW